MIKDLRAAVKPATSRRDSQSTTSLDAVATSLRLFDRQWRSLRPAPTSGPSRYAEAVERAATRGLENDFITDDSVVFPGWKRAPRPVHGWWEFHSRGRRLLVKNINFSPAEAKTGADLVYVRRKPDACVLVQYKMLERLSETGEQVYRPDKRLPSQLDRMLAYATGPIVDDIDGYRLGSGFTFVKILEDAGTRPLREDELTRGYYLPSEIVKIMLESPDEGPQGGKVHYVARRRYIDTETFARLVQDSWLGSTGKATALLEQTLGLLPQRLRQRVTLAVDEPLA